MEFDSNVVIGGRRIGGGAPSLVVAEAGVNHNGDERRALELVDAAVFSGADAVKFQIFRAAELASVSAPVATYQAAGDSNRGQRDMLQSLELSQDAWRRIRAYCQERSILFLATPFDDQSVAQVVDLDVPAIKLSSTDLNNRGLQQAASSARCPLIISTGAATEKELESAVGYLCSIGIANRLILLHCVSCYPAPLVVANLRAIGTLATRFDLPVGLSDHTTSTQTGGWAVAAGASVVEKHLTIDRSDKGPDHAMSLDPLQFRKYVALIREAESALGSGLLGATSVENDVRNASRRSVVALGEIKAGTVLTGAMLAVKRPGTGIEPGAMDKLIGRKTSQDIPADALLDWEMVE